MLVKKSPCEIFVFLVGISLFIFFGGFAIYIYFQFTRPAMEKSIIVWIINSLLSTAIAFACAVGDKKVQTTARPLIKAIMDNSTHATVGFFSAIIVFSNQNDLMQCLQLAVGCLMMSSLIDADHFFAARSLMLADATNLQSRPFLHNSTIPVLLIVILICCRVFSNNSTIISWLTVLILAFVTHHLRDANRRGLWFAPFGSTRAFPDSIYILMIIVTPYIAKYFEPDGIKYMRLKTTTVEVV